MRRSSVPPSTVVDIDPVAIELVVEVFRSFRHVRISARRHGVTARRLRFLLLLNSFRF